MKDCKIELGLKLGLRIRLAVSSVDQLDQK